MKIPKKINPDNLKDTIVQVLFSAGLPQELLLGAFNNTFSDTFKFVAASPNRKELKFKGGEGLLVDTGIRGYFLNKDETVKVDVSGSAIVFNTYKEYIGWENYFPVISSTIEKLFTSGLIKEINRIGIRYLSQFENISLIDNLNMSLSIEIPNKNLKSTQLRTEYTENEFKVILTLINGIEQIVDEAKEKLNISIIDIDVIQFPVNMVESKPALRAITEGHQKQKATFFSLLKPAFLETLNPEY